jgi:hypothetical protein
MQALVRAAGRRLSAGAGQVRRMSSGVSQEEEVKQMNLWRNVTIAGAWVEATRRAKHSEQRLCGCKRERCLRTGCWQWQRQRALLALGSRNMLAGEPESRLRWHCAVLALCSAAGVADRLGDPVLGAQHRALRPCSAEPQCAQQACQPVAGSAGVQPVHVRGQRCPAFAVVPPCRCCSCRWPALSHVRRAARLST